MQGLVIHPADHEHLPRVELLGNGGKETRRVSLEQAGDGGIEGTGRSGHAPILPCRRAGALRVAVRSSGETHPAVPSMNTRL
jgi:hypothetical protein